MRKIVIIGLLAALPALLAAQTVIQPKVKTPTSFAIVIDSKSYEQVKGAVEAYRDVVEQDGLATYIVHDAWSSPETIRNLLIKLHTDAKSPLEGAVFVGDVPIPMLRDAQHFTSAFKMDQRRNWQQSSIPSDRYYDDFGLKFDFIKQDTARPLYFYYSLRADSRQTLSSDIYTARMRPLEKGKEDKYVQLEKYLRKVVAIRTAERDNVVDNLSMGRGHGYTSESKVAWSGEQMALEQQFAKAFMAGGKVRFMDFESRFPIKPYFMNEIMRPDMDIMLFHHHGSYYYQYLNGYKNGSDPNTSIANIKLYLRSKVQSAVESGKTREEAVEHYMKYLDVPRSWCEEAFDPKKIEEDSLFNLTLDISVPDLLSIAPNPRFVMFDACYNGSFHRDENVAGAYIFNDGRTIATQANTVNTVQDKWPDEFLGLLAGGLRVGQWNKHVHYLETHIIGDPTFHFANNTLDFDINAALTQHAKDTKFWLAKTNHSNPDVQAIAWTMLYENNYPGLSKLLREAYFSSPWFTVRMEALNLLSAIGGPDLRAVLKASVDDSFELVRRFTMEYICKDGSDELIPAFVRSLLTDNTSERVYFKAGNMVKLLDTDKVAAEINRQLALAPVYDHTIADKMLIDLPKYKKSEQETLAAIADPKTVDKEARQEIQLFRNHPSPRAIETLLAYASDTSRPEELRICAVEALGWYVYSYRKPDVVAGLKKIEASKPTPAIAAEATKSIGRLAKAQTM